MHAILRRFLELESSSGVLLFFSGMLALIIANSPLAPFYHLFLNHSLFVINDALMAVFFLLVGLELRRGFQFGAFKDRSQVILPLFAAIGGMIVPALIFWLLNRHDEVLLRGMATPIATDIAFALGVLSLFGKRVPVSLKLFLLALAIFDDLGAIIIIALCYTNTFVGHYLVMSALAFLVLYLLNVLSVQRLWPYLILGVLLWVGLFKGGVHPTIAGVLLAFTMPAGRKHSPANHLEETLHPYVAYGIMPLFAFANAGLSLTGFTFDIFKDTLVLGIIFGLFFGKQLGVTLFTWVTWLTLKVKFPEKTTWLAFYGMALLCGIGFTMSLFLGTLSFQGLSSSYIAKVQIGVMSGSLLSAVFGGVVLKIALASNKK